MQDQDRTLKSKLAMLEALEKTLGVVTTAANIVGIDRTTHYIWLEHDEDYKRAVNDIENVAIDFAESHLHKQIKKGNTPATVFYLKTKGKKRGYVEKSELDISAEIKPINIQLQIDSDTND
jgi:hypothetical protein|tara:strand:+ start:13281 stop:13643 length:363 start_codon:yes stop_codon:yes gene_type:complete